MRSKSLKEEENTKKWVYRMSKQISTQRCLLKKYCTASQNNAKQKSFLSNNKTGIGMLKSIND